MRRKLVSFFIVLLFLLFIGGGLQLFKSTKASPLSVSLLMMPEETINYTICCLNGSLWAKVDGTYPMEKFDVECTDQLLLTNNTLFTFIGDSLPLLYPTPPGTTNISVKLDSEQINWSNYTQNYPDATHYTALGDWPMISSTVFPVADNFTLKIHYEHPIELLNGSNSFLYDLNVIPYLSPWSNKSVAYFHITFETNYTDLQVNTISVDGTLKPVDYAIIPEEETETVTLQVVSKYYKPLPGDLLISFIPEKNSEQNNPPSSGFELLAKHGYTLEIITLVSVILIGIILAIIFYRSKIVKPENKSRI